MFALTIVGIPPFSTVMTFGERVKNSWSDPATELPVPHAELWTAAQFAETNIPVGTGLERLRQAGFTAATAESHMRQLATQNGRRPIEERPARTRGRDDRHGVRWPWEVAVGDVQVASVERHIGQLSGRRHHVLHQALEGHLALERLDFAGVSIEQDDAAVRTANPRGDACAATRPRAVQLAHGFRLVAGHQLLQQACGREAASAGAESWALSTARVLASAVSVEHRDGKEPVPGGNAVEEDGIETAPTIELGEEARVVEETLLNLRLGLPTRRLVGPSRGGDRVAKSDRLLAERLQQVAAGGGVVEPANHEEANGSERTGCQDTGGAKR